MRLESMRTLPHYLKALAAAFLATPAVAQAPREADWFYPSFGNVFGVAGLEAAEEDGVAQIIHDDSGKRWVVSRRSAQTGAYEPVFASPEGEWGDLRDLLIADLTGDGGLEIAILDQWGRIEVRDFLDFSILARWQTQVADPQQMIAHELLLGGGDELVIAGLAETEVLDSFGSSRALYQVGGVDLAIGQVDDDGSPELVVADGSVVDLQSGLLQSSDGNGFGIDLELADIDADGRDELIVVREFTGVYAYDLETQSEKWYLSDDRAHRIKLADLDRDQQGEFVVGRTSSPDVICYDIASLQQEWDFSGPDGGTSNLQLVELDGDRELELVFASGATRSGPDGLTVCDGPSGTVDWQTPDFYLRGWFRGPQFGDLDGDGKLEMIFIGHESLSTRPEAHIVVIDAETRTLRAVSPEVFDSSAEQLHDFRVLDPDGDGRDEIFLAAEDNSYAAIESWTMNRWNHFQRKWQGDAGPSQYAFRCMQVVDLDGDGTLEIIAGTSAESSRVSGVQLVVYDHDTGVIVAQSPAIGKQYYEEMSGLRVGDFNGDGIREVIAILKESDAYVFSGRSLKPKLLMKGKFTALTSRVLPSSGRSTAYLGDTNGWLRGIRDLGAGPEVFLKLRLGKDPIDAIHFLPQDRAAIASAGRIHLVDIAAGRRIAVTAFYGDRFGKDLALLPASQLLLSSGPTGLFGFQVQ
jgi:hypothetical protein